MESSLVHRDQVTRTQQAMSGTGVIDHLVVASRSLILWVVIFHGLP
jgi:hypothetical protein